MKLSIPYHIAKPILYAISGVAMTTALMMHPYPPGSRWGWGVIGACWLATCAAELYHAFTLRRAVRNLLDEATPEVQEAIRVWKEMEEYTWTAADKAFVEGAGKQGS